MSSKKKTKARKGKKTATSSPTSWNVLLWLPLASRYAVSLRSDAATWTRDSVWLLWLMSDRTSPTPRTQPVLGCQKKMRVNNHRNTRYRPYSFWEFTVLCSLRWDGWILILLLASVSRETPQVHHLHPQKETFVTKQMACASAATPNLLENSKQVKTWNSWT